MSAGNTTHFDHIERHLCGYEAGVLSLEGLQANLEGELGALEGPGVLELRRSLDNFVNLIEQYLYTLPQNKRAAKMPGAIASLRSALAGARQTSE